MAGDIALLIVGWSMRGTTQDGYDLDLFGTATDGGRRDQDGRWQCVIDNPFETS